MCTRELIMRLVDFGEVALSQQVRELEDVVLYFLVDRGVVGALMFDHPI